MRVSAQVQGRDDLDRYQRCPIVDPKSVSFMKVTSRGPGIGRCYSVIVKSNAKIGTLVNMRTTDGIAFSSRLCSDPTSHPCASGDWGTWLLSEVRYDVSTTAPCNAVHSPPVAAWPGNLHGACKNQSG